MFPDAPSPALIILIGASGSGKSTFAYRHFLPTEIISSDRCRALICDDESNQEVTADAFQLLHLLARKRLKYRRLTVVDATNLNTHFRQRLLALAFQFNVPAVAIVFRHGEAVCQARNQRRSDRTVPAEVIRQQLDELNRIIPGLESEGFHEIVFVEETATPPDNWGLPS